jgi:hypothetical protein
MVPETVTDENNSDDTDIIPSVGLEQSVPGKYKGYKWGLFLRAPSVFFNLLQRGGAAFVPLHTIGEVKRGITSGCDKFFFPRDVTEDCLRRYPDPRRFKDQYGIARNQTSIIRLVEAGDKTIHAVETEYLEPEVHTVLELDSVEINLQQLKHVAFLVSKKKVDLKGTYALKYIEWGEREGFHLRSSMSGRMHWYDITAKRRSDVLWCKSHQYRHMAWLNSHHLVANCRLYDLFLPPEVDGELLCASLNSTIVALSKIYFGRNVGTEGAVDTEVLYACMMLVPDSRCATPEIAARLKSALEQLRSRQAMPLVNVDDIGPELSGELAMKDRQDLDDATLALLGISDASERKRLLDALYSEITHLFREIRKTERIMQKFRTKNAAKGKPTVGALVDEILESAPVENEPLVWHTPFEYLSPEASCDVINVPLGKAKITSGGLLPDVTVGKDTIAVNSLSQARWIKALSDAGLSGSLRVPRDEADVESALRAWEEGLAALDTRLITLAGEYTVEASMQKKVIAELKRRLQNDSL